MDRNTDTKWMWIVPMAVLLVILLGFASYQWLIPRTDLEVRTVYHEAPGGGGTGGTINVNVLLTNMGNRDVSTLKCDVIVMLEGGGSVARHSLGPESLGQGENVEIKMPYIGSQYDNYLIDIEVSFDSSGDSHYKSLNYQTEEDVMNIVFVENL
jgi:hypothetical protein